MLGLQLGRLRYALNLETLYIEVPGESPFAPYTSRCLLLSSRQGAGTQGLGTRGAAIWNVFKDGPADLPCSNSDDMLKFVSFCVGEVCDYHAAKSFEVQELLRKIRTECLEWGEGCCFIESESQILLPQDYASFIAYGLAEYKVMVGFYELCRLKEGKRQQAFAYFKSIHDLVTGTMNPLDGSLRLLLDRDAMRALFRRPDGDDFSLLNKNSHPRIELLKGPRFSSALLWLSRFPEAPNAEVENRMRRLASYDQSLLHRWAIPMSPNVMSRFNETYIRVSSDFRFYVCSDPTLITSS